MQKAAGQTAKEQVKAALKQGASQLHKRGVRANPADRTTERYVDGIRKAKGGNPTVTRNGKDIARHRIDGHKQEGPSVSKMRYHTKPDGEVIKKMERRAVPVTQKDVKKLYKGDTQQGGYNIRTRKDQPG